MMSPFFSRSMFPVKFLKLEGFDDCIAEAAAYDHATLMRGELLLTTLHDECIVA